MGEPGSRQRGTRATFVISVAAELAGMHPQTLRQYDRLGLVSPARTKGRGRRYSSRDVDLLREIQRLSQEEGINLAGIRRILDLQREVEALRAERDALASRVADVEARSNRVFAASASGEVSQMRRGARPVPRRRGDGEGELVVWDPWAILRAARAHAAAPQRARAVIESGRRRIDVTATEGGAVRVIEGTISTSVVL